MKITYDAPQDTLRILFSDAPISQTNSPNHGVTLDYDQYGHLVGLELTAASKQVANPYKAELVMSQLPPPEGSGLCLPREAAHSDDSPAGRPTRLTRDAD